LVLLEMVFRHTKRNGFLITVQWDIISSDSDSFLSSRDIARDKVFGKRALRILFHISQIHYVNIFRDFLNLILVCSGSNCWMTLLRSYLWPGAAFRCSVSFVPVIRLVVSLNCRSDLFGLSVIFRFSLTTGLYLSFAHLNLPIPSRCSVKAIISI
jgi:hypothetical protein